MGEAVSLCTLGVDPGLDGGAVLLGPDGRRVIDVWAWQQIGESKTRWNYWRGELGPWELPSLFEIGADIARICEGTGHPWQVYGEGLFAWQGRLEVVVPLAEATGELLGPLRVSAAQVVRPLARDWRPVVLGGHAYQSSDLAEENAWHRCAVGRPRLVEGLERGPWLERKTVKRKGHEIEVPAWPHVLEAACLARFGWLEAQGPLRPALLEPVRKPSRRARG